MRAPSFVPLRRLVRKPAGAAGRAAAGAGVEDAGACCGGFCGAGAAAFCRFLLCGWGGGRSGGGASGVNHADDGLNGHGLAFADFDLFQHAGGGRRNFRVHLVGGDFKERLVALDLVTGLLEPLGDGAFENAFAHLRHYDVNGHGVLLEILESQSGKLLFFRACKN